jgi:Kinesin motor domain
VCDLFTDKTQHTLKVREHPQTGAFVEGLTTLSVTSYEQIQELLEKGTARRVTGKSCFVITIHLKLHYSVMLCKQVLLLSLALCEEL